MAGAVQKAAEQRREETTNAPARSNALQLRDAIKASEQQFALALPKHVDTGRFLRAALTAINVVPKLGQCTQTSVLAGLMQAAQLGLEVADVRGQAYLIPRWNGRQEIMEATFQLGYRGMIDLAARGGITVTVDDICERDEYDFQRGTTPYLKHRPNLGDRGAVIAYYAVATFADDRVPAFAILGHGEAERHRDRFASTKDKQGNVVGPWVEHFDAMARKTVVRRLLNYLPATVELRQAVAIDASASEDVGMAFYGAPLSVPELPENIDAETGEIAADPTAAIDTDVAEPADADGQQALVQ